MELDSDNVPRLRRGSSFVSRDTDGKPRLRRSRRIDEPEPRAFGHVESTSSLPRAGTFAYGMAKAPPVMAELKEASSTDKMPRKNVCGMCSSCMTGANAMPRWAPERLKMLSEEERDVVVREMQHNEEKGRLEAELRKKRVDDMQAVASRLQAKRSRNGRATREQLATDTASSSEYVTKPSADSELESIDLTATIRYDGNSQASSAEPLSARAGLPLPTVRREHRLRGCQTCSELEIMVNDLEEQLAVLRDVTKLCIDNEQADKVDEEEAKRAHGKGWMGKIASAYYGSAAAANEKQRLKEEVDALKKATDFLFQKLQPTPQ